MKYVVFKTVVNGVERELPVIFPEELVHAQVAARLERLINESGDGSAQVVAAGMIRVDSVVCTGRSETLSRNSRGSRDKKLIEEFEVTRGFAT